MSVTRNFKFSKRRRDCYKAAIFVARAYGCYKVFKNEGRLPLNLEKKVLACLKMMEENLPDEDSKKKRTSTDSAVRSPVDFAPLTNASSEPPKRKRGRPPKNPRPEPVQLKDDKADHASESEVEFDGNLDNTAAENKKKKRKSASEAWQKGALAEPSSDDNDDPAQMYPYNAPARGKPGEKEKCTT